jgi:hypothetical protein
MLGLQRMTQLLALLPRGGSSGGRFPLQYVLPHELVHAKGHNCCWHQAQRGCTQAPVQTSWA